MNFYDIAKSRFSVRKYSNQKIEKEKLDKILSVAHIAPTAVNLQPVRIIVVQSDSGFKKLGKTANTYNAPLALIVCSDHSKAWKRPFDGKQTNDIDASIITDHMMLQATELGLGSVWICYFEPNIIKREFNLPDELEPVNILALGYSDEQPANPERHNTQRISIDKLIYSFE